MRRLLLVAVLVAGVPLAVSAPVPKPESPEKKLGRLFGTPVAPKGATVKLNGEKLRLEVVKRAERKRNPDDPFFWLGVRTERNVSGDFEVTVRVRPSGDPPVSMSAGLYIQFGKDFYFSYSRGIRIGDPPDERILQGHLNGNVEKNLTSCHLSVPLSPTVALRITRQGRELTGAMKDGDADWAGVVAGVADVPKNLAVGVWLCGDNKDCAAEFEDFKVTPLK